MDRGILHNLGERTFLYLKLFDLNLLKVSASILLYHVLLLFGVIFKRILIRLPICFITKNYTKCFFTYVFYATFLSKLSFRNKQGFQECL